MGTFADLPLPLTAQRRAPTPFHAPTPRPHRRCPSTRSISPGACDRYMAPIAPLDQPHIPTQTPHRGHLTPYHLLRIICGEPGRTQTAARGGTRLRPRRFIPKTRLVSALFFIFNANIDTIHWVRTCLKGHEDAPSHFAFSLSSLFSQLASFWSHISQRSLWVIVVRRDSCTLPLSLVLAVKRRYKLSERCDCPPLSNRNNVIVIYG